MIPVHVLEKNTGNLYSFFFPSSFNRKYVHTIACTVVFFFNAYPGRNATCPLSSCSNKNDGPCGRFNCISIVACKGFVCVEVLTVSMVGSSLKWDNLINSKSLHIVPPLRQTLRQPFFLFIAAPPFGALNLPEVNQFTGNCFRMVRIVLKITFLNLRYPKGVTGRLPRCPIMALVLVYFLQKAKAVNTENSLNSDAIFFV